jgi:hypothetical protein
VAPTTVDDLPADKALVRTFFHDEPASTGNNLPTPAAHISAHNYPDHHHTPSECLTMPTSGGLTNAYAETGVPDFSAMSPDPD